MLFLYFLLVNFKADPDYNFTIHTMAVQNVENLNIFNNFSNFLKINHASWTPPKKSFQHMDCTRHNFKNQVGLLISKYEARNLEIQGHTSQEH